MMELFRSKQEPGQNIQSFLASLKAKAGQCEFVKQVTCTNKECITQISVSFDTEIISDLLLAGLKDAELQQDLMAEENLTLDKVVRIAQSRETAKSSHEVLDPGTTQSMSALSTYKK